MTKSFEIPATWGRLQTIDAHAAGEPLRVVTGGWPEIPGKTILAKRQFARENHDSLRRALMWEPRGHADMYGCILTEPVTPDGDVGVLFLHNEGYSTMCGHGIIGLVKVGLECGLLNPAELEADTAGQPIVNIDTPAGRVTATAHLADSADRPRVTRVSFFNVPSFVLEPDLRVEVQGFGSVRCDVAFGGAFYAYVDAADMGLAIDPGAYAPLIDAGRRVKRAVTEQYEIVHPDGDPDLNFLYGTIFVQEGEGDVHSRNACIFAEGEVDRSPTGTGVSGRAAIHHFRGDLVRGETIRIESIIGTSFTVSVAAETTVGNLPAIVPEVAGTAHITGLHEFLIDPEDPFRDGFFLR